MVGKIRALKDEILQYIDETVAKHGADGVDSGKLGEYVDMVKDLAEAEAMCYKAEYYATVIDEMSGKAGYGTQVPGNREIRSASRRYYGTRAAGHHEVDELVARIRGGDDAEKEHILRELMEKL